MKMPQKNNGGCCVLQYLVLQWFTLQLSLRIVQAVLLLKMKLDLLSGFLPAKIIFPQILRMLCTMSCHRGNLEMKDLRIWYKSSKMPIFWKVLGGTYIEALGIRLMTRETQSFFSPSISREFLHTKYCNFILVLEHPLVCLQLGQLAKTYNQKAQKYFWIKALLGGMGMGGQTIVSNSTTFRNSIIQKTVRAHLFLFERAFLNSD